MWLARSRTRLISALLLFIGLIGLGTGCLDVPLGDSQMSTVDPQLTGWWEDREANTLTYASAFDAHSYLITVYGLKDEGGQKKPSYMLVAKCWLTRIAGMDILTCKMVDPRWELQDEAEVKKRYSFYRIKHNGAQVQYRRLNEELLAEAKTPEAMAKLIEDHAKKDDLWDATEPERTMTPIPDSRRDELKKILDQIFPS